MKLANMLTALFALGFIVISPIAAGAEEDEDFAVPAFSDLHLLTTASWPSSEQLRTVRYSELIKPLDINEDLQFNDFDVKHFQSIVSKLNGADLTGLQLATRFRNAQKNQANSFPVLYDLDRDGYFSRQDVDKFASIVNDLGDGAMRGEELVGSYRMKISPREKK